jgi:hypothetical protein
MCLQWSNLIMLSTSMLEDSAASYACQSIPGMGRIFCIDRFDDSLNYNRSCRVVHETDTPFVFNLT